jgi:mRNA interferase RelE/StbE
MRYAVKVRPQVREFAATLGQEHRRVLKRAVLGLANERGDIRGLTDRLHGYYRLRVGTHRVKFRYLPGRVIECDYAHERRLVYDILESEIGRIVGE